MKKREKTMGHKAWLTLALLAGHGPDGSDAYRLQKELEVLPFCHGSTRQQIRQELKCLSSLGMVELIRTESTVKGTTKNIYRVTETGLLVVLSPLGLATLSPVLEEPPKAVKRWTEKMADGGWILYLRRRTEG